MSDCKFLYTIILFILLTGLNIRWQYALDRDSTLNCIEWWDSTSGDLRTHSLPLLPGQLWPVMIVIVRDLPVGQIELLEKLFVYDRTVQKKEKFEITTTRKI